MTMKMTHLPKSLMLLVVAAYVLLHAACIALQPIGYEMPPEDIQVPPVEKSGVFVYTERAYARCAQENPVLIRGAIENPAFSLKDAVLFSADRKKVWDFTVLSRGLSYAVRCDFTVHTGENGKNERFDVAPVVFGGNQLSFAGSITERDVSVPYLVADIHDEAGRRYTVFALERTAYRLKTPWHIVLDTKQEFSVLLGNRLVAHFSASQYHIYAGAPVELLETYVSVLNGVFRGLQKYENGILVL